MFDPTFAIVGFTVMGNDGGIRVLRKTNKRHEERHIQ